MEGLSVSKVFGVPEDYTLEQLKKSYIEMINNLYKSDRTEVEKQLLIAQYKQMYKFGKSQYLEKVSMETDMEETIYPYNSSHCGELDLFDRFERMHENVFEHSKRIRRTYNPFSMFDNVFRNVEQNISNSNPNPKSNPNSKVYSYSSSYSSNTNPDGSRTIIEKKSESTNGDKKQTINAYKKMPDGKTVPLSEDEMKGLEKFSGLQIEN